MEHVIPEKIKTYFYNTLVKNEFERFQNLIIWILNHSVQLLLIPKIPIYPNYISINYSHYYIPKTKTLNQTMNIN